MEDGLLDVFRPFAPNTVSVGGRQVVLRCSPPLGVGLAGSNFQGLLVVEDGLLDVFRPFAPNAVSVGVRQVVLRQPTASG